MFIVAFANELQQYPCISISVTTELCKSNHTWPGLQVKLRCTTTCNPGGNEDDQIVIHKQHIMHCFHYDLTF